MSNEILSLAYTLELQGLKMYENLADKDEIFTQILAIKKSGLELLKNYANELKCELSDEILPFIKPENLDDCLIKALNYEIELDGFYENATDNINDEFLKDLFFRLWATSNNEYIAALKARLKEIYTPSQEQKIDDKQNIFDTNSLNEISSTIEKFASGKASNEDFMALIKSPNFSFLGGLAVGGLTAMMVNKNENLNKE